MTNILAEMRKAAARENAAARRIWEADVCPSQNGGGAPKTPPKREISPARRARIDQIEAMMGDGLTAAQMAHELGVSVVTIRSDFRLMAKKDRAVWRGVIIAAQRAARRDQVEALAKEGLSQAEIGRRLGVARGVPQRDLEYLRKVGRI